jgi:thermostable 8-oxoguanine DNA glycosylase
MNKAQMIGNFISIHKEIKERIESQLDTFRKIWDSGIEKDIFIELSFCFLTPQSKAFSCWEAIENLKSSGLFKKNYFNIEKKMKKFSETVKIPLSHLDFILWFKEAGEVFK